jgi:t-SNARE complex subunit (syntaxin)
VTCEDYDTPIASLLEGKNSQSVSMTKKKTKQMAAPIGNHGAKKKNKKQMVALLVTIMVIIVIVVIMKVSFLFCLLIYFCFAF